MSTRLNAERQTVTLYHTGPHIGTLRMQYHSGRPRPWSARFEPEVPIECRATDGVRQIYALASSPGVELVQDFGPVGAAVLDFQGMLSRSAVDAWTTSH